MKPSETDRQNAAFVVQRAFADTKRDLSFSNSKAQSYFSELIEASPPADNNSPLHVIPQLHIVPRLLPLRIAAMAKVLVWASGFSAAFLKKQSVATKGHMITNERGLEVSGVTKGFVEAKPAFTEAALLLVLEKFFEVVLSLPAVNRHV